MSEPMLCSHKKIMREVYNNKNQSQCLGTLDNPCPLVEIKKFLKNVHVAAFSHNLLSNGQIHTVSLEIQPQRNIFSPVQLIPAFQDC